MFHYFAGTITETPVGTMVISGDQGIIVKYLGKKHKWWLYLHASVDRNDGHIEYLAFDDIQQLVRFKTILKIKGIWPKISQLIANRPESEISQAVKDFDTGYFATLPWVWPKTAKRICIELKSKVEKEDIQLSEDKQQIYKSITATLKNLWYDGTKIKTYIHQYPHEIDKTHTGDIIKWIISHYE